MADSTKERKVGYVVDEEIDGVTCRHSVTHRDSTTGERTRYEVVSIHDFSDLSHRALLKLAAMQGKIKMKEDMAIRAHAGKTTFEYTWVDADVDGKTRTSSKAKDDRTIAELLKVLEDIGTPEQVAAAKASIGISL